jgi:ABC-type lipopolysaccharide export system ATPase subunit
VGELGGEEGWQTVVGVYCMREKSIFSKKKKKDNLQMHMERQREKKTKPKQQQQKQTKRNPRIANTILKFKKKNNNK